jgi:hypothetical protein
VPAGLELDGGVLPVSRQRVLALGPSCGLLLSSAENGGAPLTVVDAFRFDELGGFQARRLDVLAGALDSQDISRNPAGQFAWLTEGSIRAYRCADGRDFTIPRGDEVLALTQYREIPRHLTGELVEVPE